MLQISLLCLAFIHSNLTNLAEALNVPESDVLEPPNILFLFVYFSRSFLR
jgi:hypothetical protein